MTLFTSIRHAGMWNRYYALRLTVNDIMLKTLSILAKSFQLDTKSLEEAAHLRMLHLANDLCASVPYTLGLIEPHQAAVHDGIVVFKVPPSLNVAVKATDHGNYVVRDIRATSPLFEESLARRKRDRQ